MKSLASLAGRRRSSRHRSRSSSSRRAGLGRADPLREDVGRRQHRDQREGAAALPRSASARRSSRCRATRAAPTRARPPLGHLADQTGLPFPLQTGTRAAHASNVDDRYVTVLASVRGTGCSSGEFDLFSWRSALDGKEVIDKWIAKQPWSDGNVVIFGHSYSGITGLFVASTRPEHLKAVSASGLIGDLYRDIVYPGGVTNYGFPLLWTGAIRVVYDVGGGTVGGLYPVEDTSAAVRGQPGRAPARAPRGPADPRPRRHGRQLVPLALAGQLRGPHQRPGAHHVRLPGRADRPARPDVRVRQALELDLQAARAGQRRPRHQHRGPRVQGPHRVDGLLDAEQDAPPTSA